MASMIKTSSTGLGCSARASPRRVHASGLSPVVRPCQHLSLQTRSRQPCVAVRAERNGDSNFMTGFVLGGVVFGALGFLFAPQISKALLGDDQRLKLPRFLEDEANKDPEATKQELIEKIAQLNASIDEVAAKLEKTDVSQNSKVEVAA